LPQQFAFYNEATQGGGFAAPPGGGILNTFGPMLYSGRETTPTFSLGTFQLVNGAPDGPIGTLVISSAGVTPLPETSSLLLLGTALVLFGLMRKKLVHRATS